MKIRAAGSKEVWPGACHVCTQGTVIETPLLTAAEGQGTWPAGVDFKGFLILLFSILISDLHGKDYATEVSDTV